MILVFCIYRVLFFKKYLKNEESVIMKNIIYILIKIIFKYGYFLVLFIFYYISMFIY